MNHYGISTNNSPIFLGGECVVEHVKTLRLQYKNIQHDQPMHIDAFTNNIEQVKKISQEKGWVDISLNPLDLNNLFAFIGEQDYHSVKTSVIIEESPIPIKPIKFRHFNGKTQARIAVQSPLHWVISGHNPEGFVEIFIYHRASNITPEKGYGIHIYNENGALRYKSGLKLLNNIRVLPVNFTHHKTLAKSFNSPFELDKNPIFKNPIGKNIAVMQTCNFIYTECYKVNRNWYYYGSILTPVLTIDGKIEFQKSESFSISGYKRNYPSYAKGDEYLDNITAVNQVLIIDKPTN